MCGLITIVEITDTVGDINLEQKATILIVDDTPENIDVLAASLKDKYKIKVATNGEMALKVVEKSPELDLILLDIMMPGIDGFEVCRRLKSQVNTRSVPIIFVTAKITSEDELLGLEMGAVDYITKPISPPVVIQRVKTHIALHDQNRELYNQVRNQTETIEQTRLRIIQRLGRAAEYKDNETGLHVIRMSYYSRLLGIAVGMSECDADLLFNAAPMHDIGKIGIPDAILKKPGKLDPDEWSVMQQHASIGGEILGDDGDCKLLNMAQSVALTHHEKWDGSGYPNGLVGKQIPIEGRIVALADVFDALTSERPYKKAWSIDDALALIERESGAHFDPDLAALFLTLRPQLEEIQQKYAENSEHM